MKEEYKKAKLSSVVEYLNRGVSPSYSNSGTLVLNQKCIRETVSFDEARYTDSSKKKILREKYLQQYDIVICSTGVGTLGRVGQINNPITNTTVDSHVTIVRPSPEIVNPKYLGYVLKSKQKDIEFLAEGSTGQTELSRIKLSSLELSLPPLPEQHRISNILSSFDNKIELLRKENNTLEDIAQSIFKEWFVKYNFPNKDGKPYRDNNGKMIDSELGLIPDGWRVATYGEMGELKNGINYSRDENGDTVYKIVNTRDVIRTNFIDDTNLETISIDQKKAKGYQIDDKDILIVRSASPGQVAVVQNSSGIILYSGFIIKLRPTIKDSKWFLYEDLREKGPSLTQYSEGTVLKNINQQIINKTPLVFPSNDILEKYTHLVSNIYDKIWSNYMKDMRLYRIQQLLLNKLIK